MNVFPVGYIVYHIFFNIWLIKYRINSCDTDVWMCDIATILEKALYPLVFHRYDKTCFANNY